MDPSPAVLGVVQQELAGAQKLGVNLVHVGTAADAEAKIKAITSGHVAVVGHPAVSDKPLRAALEVIGKLKPRADFFVVAEGKSVLGDVKTLGLASLGEIPGPISSAGLAQVFNKGLASSQQEVKSAALDLNDSEMVAIDADKLLLASAASFDVFLRLAANRYVKIVNQGEVADAAQIQKYIQRGTEHFYITKSSQEVYVRYTETLADAVTRSAALGVDKKLSVTMNFGNEAINMLAMRGISEDNMRYASSYVTTLSGVLKAIQVQAKDNPSILSQHLSKTVMSHHNASLAATSGLMAKALGLESEKSVQIIGLASSLHDIGITALGFKLDEDVDPAKLSPTDRARYETHPTVGADEVRKLKHFDPTLVQAIEQHHLRRNGKGYPQNANRKYIQVVAEIIGICDEFDYLIRLKLSTEPHLDLRRRMESLFDDFSKPVVQAFQATFFR